MMTKSDSEDTEYLARGEHTAPPLDILNLVESHSDTSSH